MRFSTQASHARDVWDSRLQDFQLLVPIEALDESRDIPAWPGVAGHQPALHRIVPERKDDRNRRVVACMAARVAGVPCVTMRSTLCVTNSAASAGSCSRVSAVSLFEEEIVAFDVP